MLATAGVLAAGIFSLGFVGSTGFADDSSETDDDGSGGSKDAPPGNGQDGGFQTDEEYVGTLPTEDTDEDAPGFYVQGPREAILGSFHSIGGSGFFKVEYLGTYDESTGQPDIRVYFMGDLEVTLDRSVLDTNVIQLGVHANVDFGTTIASAMTETTMLMIEPVEAGSLEIPFSSYEQSGLLQYDGVQVVTANRTFGRGVMGVSACGGNVHVTQGPLE